MAARLPDCLTIQPGEAQWRRPLDVYDLAVRLEAEGVTDEVALADYGFATTLEMARDYQSTMGKRPATPAAHRAAPSFWRAWLSGTAFAVPMLVCALALTTLGVSLWGGDVPADTAAAIAIATVASLVVTGGFVQAMARRGLFHTGAANYTTAAALCRAWATAGAIAATGTACLLLGANLVFNWLPPLLANWAGAFFVLLSLFWLACGGLYVARRGQWVIAATVGGVAVVAALRLGLGVDLLAAQMCGIAAATLTAAAGTLRYFHSHGVAWTHTEQPGFAPARELYYAAPYLLYGALYYIFMFTDRLLAWTAGTNAAALPLQFRGDYETALDLAMIALVPQAGLVQASLVSFHEEVRRVQASLPAGQFSRFNAALREFYWWRVARLALFGFAAGGAVYAAVAHWGWLPFADMRPVLVLALAAFPVLVVGLWNASLLFALGTPTPAAGAALAGILFSLAPGYLLTRTGGYDAAAVGFAIGAFAFAATSAVSVLKRFRSLDHFYYASAL